jgi:predicted nucleotidyltransferase
MAKTGKLALTAALNHSETLALQAFIGQVQSAYPRQICQVSLFGSKARGDSQVDSDVDILVLVSDEDRGLRKGIIDIASSLSLEYDVLLSPRVIGERRWKARQGFSLYRNIARDALTLPLV